MKVENKNHWASAKKEKKVNVSKFFRLATLHYVLVVIFLGVTVYSFGFSNLLEINDITAESDGSLVMASVKQRVDEEMNKKYLGIISRKNLIFFNSKGMENNLKAEFKKIKKVTIEKSFPNKVKITIIERDLVLVLCAKGNCYFIDENGYAYARADLNSEEVKQNKIIKLIDESGKEIGEGNYALKPEFVKFIIEIEKDLKESNSINILNEYRTLARISGEIIVQTEKGWDIYLNSQFPMAKSVRTLKTLLNRQLMLKDLNELEYIDLRSENKVFYRMKGGVAQEEEEMKKESEILDSENKENNEAVPAKIEDKKKE